MWVRSTPYGQKRIVLFDYNPSRSGEVVEQLFAQYQGYLQVDGYSGYNPVKKNKEIIEIGCNMHGTSSKVPTFPSLQFARRFESTTHGGV
jgi:transposase